MKNKQLSISSRHIVRHILGSNYPGTKGHQGGINWIPICASSHQVSLLGRPLTHAKDSARFNCSNKTTDSSSFVSRVTPITSVLGGQGEHSWSMRSRWCFEAVMNTMHYSSVLRCANRAAQQSCDGWLLSALSQLACSAGCVLLTLSLLIPTAIQVSSEGWGSSLKP